MKHIFNYLYLEDKLSSSGMPTPEQLKDIAQAGKEVLINLATDKSEGAFANEGELAEQLGMIYIHIPVDWGQPTRQNLDDFFHAMQTHAGRDIFVHCQANYRASAFIALYRILHQGWKKEEAFAVLTGIWNPNDHPVWKTFIDHTLAGT